MPVDVADKRVTVMGLGRFGGGVGVTRWLARQGARVTVTDLASADDLAASLEQIADLNPTLHLGGHEERDFREVDLVVVNPAVPERSDFLRAACDAGVPVTTEINLFVERCPARTVGVTGSVGKSTVTAMVGQVLSEATKGGVGEAARVWVGGNIGRSLLDDLNAMRAGDIVVLELSSFQLQRTPAVRWSPNVSVITSITPNHLDWHGDFDAYVDAKLNILRYQHRQRDVVVIQDTPTLREAVARLGPNPARLWWYGLDGDQPVAHSGGERLCWEGLTLDVPGRHNRENAAAALAVAHAFGVPPADAVAALASFEALPHRLQRVVTRDGVTYYDDSKSTTPEAALTAMRAIDAPLLVILGGYDKRSDLSEVARQAGRRARFAACIGTTGRGLADAIRAAGGAAEFCGELPAAVAACQRRAGPGDVVLLSPACASWDQFPDYRVRGEMFARLARGEEPTA